MLVPLSKNVKILFNESGFTYSNCIIVDDEVKVIMDTGADERFLDELEPESFDLVLNTHYHYDHIRGNHRFKRADVMVHTLDSEPLAGIEDYFRYNSWDRWNALMPFHDYIQSFLQIGIEEQDVWRNLKVDKAFNEKEIFDFGKTVVEVMHTPGHSAGHCCFWFPHEEFLFTGDICLTQAGPWYGEGLSDPGQMVESINRVIALKPPRMTSSHIKIIVTDGTKQLIEYRDRIYKREERIRNKLLLSPKTLEQLAEHKLVYRMHPSPFVEFWEKLMLLKHLQHLIELGLVELSPDGYYYAV